MGKEFLGEISKLVACLRVKNGSWQLEGADKAGARLSLDLEHGLRGITATLNISGKGSSNLFAASGSKLHDLLSTLGGGIGASWMPIQQVARSIPSTADNAALWKFLSTSEITPTILVIPGISALRAKLPPTNLGSIQLPECVASVSIRSLAIDIINGRLAGTITFNDIEFDGKAQLTIGEGTVVDFEKAVLLFTIDFTYSIPEKLGSVWLQSLTCQCGRTEVSVDDATGKSIGKIKADGAQISARDVVYRITKSGSEAGSGDVSIQLFGVSASYQKLNLNGGILLEDAELSVESARIGTSLRSPLVARTNMSNVAAMKNVKATFKKISLPQNSDFKVEDVTAAAGPAAIIEYLEIDLSSSRVISASAGLALNYGAAAYNKGGVLISVPKPTKKPNSLVLSCVAEPSAMETGLRAKIQSALIANADKPGSYVSLQNFAVNTYRIEHQHGLPQTHRTKLHTSINDIGFLVTGFGLVSLDLGKIPVPGDVSLIVLKTLAGLKAQAIDSALDWLAKALGDPFNFVGELANLLSFGQIRLEYAMPIIVTQPLRIKFEPKWCWDQTLAFKVSFGFHGVGVEVGYSYPCPTLTDWGRRCDGKEAPWISVPQIDLELGLAVTLDIDAAAKRIRVHSITPFLPIDAPDELKPIFAQLQGAALSVVANLMGGGWINDAVTAAINAAIPIRLPDQWDVSRLTIMREEVEDAAGNKVWGVEVGLRFEEHQFAS